VYLAVAIKQLAGSKVERVRHLFEQVLKSVPQDKCKLFLYMYADFEESFGLISLSMQVYDRATQELEQGPDLLECFNLYLAKVTQFFGISRSRAVFQRAFKLMNPD